MMKKKDRLKIEKKRFSKKQIKRKNKNQRQELRKGRGRASMPMTINLMVTFKKLRVCLKWTMILHHLRWIDLINSVPSSAGCCGSHYHQSSNTWWCTVKRCVTIMLLEELEILVILMFNQWLTFSYFLEFTELPLFLIRQLKHLCLTLMQLRKLKWLDIFLIELCSSGLFFSAALLVVLPRLIFS